MSTINDNNAEEVSEVSRKIILSKKPPTSTKPAAFSVIKQKQVPSASFATYGQHTRSASSYTVPTSSRNADNNNKGSVAISKTTKRATDDDFWEDSKASSGVGRGAAHELVDLLHNLSSLRIQLRQACAMAETVKQSALEAESRGDPFKALELMSECHQKLVEIRSLEGRIEAVKKTIMQRQQQQADVRNYSRNNKLTSQQKNMT